MKIVKSKYIDKTRNNLLVKRLTSNSSRSLSASSMVIFAKMRDVALSNNLSIRGLTKSVNSQKEKGKKENQSDHYN